MEFRLILSNKTSPPSYLCNPSKHFKNTVFPEPVCPIIKLVFPFSNSQEIPLSTGLLSNDFLRFLTFIIIQEAFGLLKN